MNKDDIRRIIGKNKTEKSITDSLNKSGIRYSIDKECDYLNIRIPTAEGYLRIYKNSRKEIIIQEFTKTKFEYSGIPVFFRIICGGNYYG